MISRVILGLAFLAVATVPAHARGGGGHGSHGSHGHHHGHHRHAHPFGGLPFAAFYAQFPYGYPCWWEEDQWVNQRYGDKYGNYTDVLEWVPGHWACPDADDPPPSMVEAWPRGERSPRVRVGQRRGSAQS